MKDRESATAYARAVESHWSRLAERPVLFSRRDWALVERWQARGIPLEIVREAMDAAAARRRGRRPFRGLGAVAEAVEETWAAILDGRTTVRAADEAPSEDELRARWRERSAGLPAGSPLTGLLESLQTRLERGEDPESLEDELDDRLGELVEPELLASVEREVEGELVGFRKRMTPDRLRATRRRATIARLRRRLGLPRLTR